MRQYQSFLTRLILLVAVTFAAIVSSCALPVAAYLAKEFPEENDASGGGSQEIQVSGNSFVVAWDAAPGTIASYRVLARPVEGGSWAALGTVDAAGPLRFEIDNQILPYGAYEFAVQSLGPAGEESSLHTSSDGDAVPTTGWFVAWSSPS